MITLFNLILIFRKWWITKILFKYNLIKTSLCVIKQRNKTLRMCIDENIL